MLGWGLLLFAVWVGLYAISWGYDALHKQWTERPAAAAAPNPIDAALASPNQPKCAVEHRFEKTDVYPVSLRADRAMDTCTGKLCKAWSWVAKDTKDTNSMWATYQDLPVCSELPDTKP